MWAFRLEYRRDHSKGKGMHRKLSISEWLEIAMEKNTDRKCLACNGIQVKNLGYKNTTPNFLYLIASGINLQVETEIKLPYSGENYRLCGVIYHGNGHFVSRIVDKSGDIWYHDGASTGENVKYEKNVLSISNQGWQKVKHFNVTAYVFTKLYSRE